MEILSSTLKNPENPKLNSLVPTILSLALLLYGCDRFPDRANPVPPPFGDPSGQGNQTPTPSK